MPIQSLIKSIVQDLEYWGVDELAMEPCCALKWAKNFELVVIKFQKTTDATRYYPQIDVCQSEKDGDIAAKKKELELAAEEDFGNTRV